MGAQMSVSGFANMFWVVLFIAIYIALALLPLVLAYAVNPPSDDPLVFDMGLAAALVGFSLLAMQVAMGARLRLLDRIYGLDVVMLFHRGMGIFAILLLLAHPILMAAGSHSTRLFGVHTSWQVDLGKAALLLLILSVALALTFSRLGMDYNLWRIFHKMMILVFMLAFIHAIVIGPDLENRTMAVYWCALFAIALLLFFWQNAAVPAWGRRQFIIRSVKPETHNTVTLELAPCKGRLFSYRPGQFVFLTFAGPVLPDEEHPFTISSWPARETGITVTIRQSGNFTNRIAAVKSGDYAWIEGPFGRFSCAFHPTAEFVFIAGGVGITPVHSMIAWLQDRGDKRPVTLIYGNRTEADIIFRDELASLPFNVKVHHVLSRPDPAWTGLKGHITAETISACASDHLAAGHFFVCGPPAMMDSTVAALRSLGVACNRIHMERFTI
jgi:predicted ferric reductase